MCAVTKGAQAFELVTATCNLLAFKEIYIKLTAIRNGERKIKNTYLLTYNFM